ncbi:uncharacterized protein Dwil_GK20901 [Drosophila willistoni]|uniref:Zinc finger FYVE domain-containing protein n=1 Tax=Drosophila willistoni TaxID=7260 RepID=B4MJV2_DROWI|nr:uncharacterized protein Dwil_GK20901 [Drosophila willistoni]
MDLVDIDQVLDNLELELAASTTAENHDLNQRRPLGDGASGGSAAPGPVGGATVVPPKSPFVGVSQVFNSLDDYRNNVKSLEQTPQTYNWQTEEQEKEDDINKFSEEQQKALKNGNETNSRQRSSSSESLTTSSCSTFSSGPSPVSQSEELSDKVPSALEVKVPSGQPPPAKEQKVNELAQGLSSISLTNTTESMLPEEVTASSALVKVINELEQMEEQDTSTKLVENIPPTEEIANPPAQAAMPVAKANKELPKHSQPLTFCSTMDEISDTELDSMLQEIDIEQEEISLSASPVTEEESVRILSEQDERESHSHDQMNVDNFSQASTVEFAELRPQETGGIVNNADGASSFGSSETDSLSGRKLEAEEALEQESQQQEAIEGKQQGEEEMVEQRPQRPQTLDLNGYQGDNAGQTPPAASTEELQPPALEGEPQVEAEANGDGLADDDSPIYEAVGYSDDPHANLGKVPPIWVPDNMAGQCMQCHQKFTMIKRRHHCRACGKVLCSICCSQKFHLEFANEQESRVCVQCFMILSERQAGGVATSTAAASAALPPTPMRSPNPNNPMEYCSTIPPHCQVAASQSGGQPPSVIVPVGVLKKPSTEGSSSNSSSSSDGQKNRKRKSVMFSDGIAPGSELASSMEQQQWGEQSSNKQTRRGQRNNSAGGGGQKPPTPASNESRSIDSTTMGLVAQLFRGSIPPSAAAATLTAVSQEPSSRAVAPVATAQTSPRRKADAVRSRKLPPNGDAQGCYIPIEENALPPICVTSSQATNCCDVDYKEVRNDKDLVERLQHETLKFIVKNNFYVYVKIVNMSCCMNRWVLNFTTSGLHHVGNDELIILLEIKEPNTNNKAESLEAVPRDVFQHLYEIYVEAENARSGIHELAFSSPRKANFLGSREHGGFIYLRPTYQCLQGVIVPENPYLVAVLIHRHEVPWAKVLPLRLILRLGAQYRYYPCPLISVRNRESVYGEIAQTIINFLVDFRNYSYSLPAIRGLFIHMEDRQTTVLIPRHRQQDVIKAINNASDHILAFAGNFSKVADGHLVCMQNINDDRTEMYAYSTQAINIQGQPRKVTGASFFVLNEALKSSSGLSGKCSIVEDGLMVQIMPAKMEEVRQALRNQTDIDIVCGPIEANEEQSELVSIKWVDNDRDINVGVKSPIDDKAMDGIANMRVHASFNYSNANYAIKLSDIFIVKCEDWYATNGGNYTDITRIAEQLARSASMALLPFLDLLAAAGINKVGLRATLDQENVGYEAGARGSKLPPLYMNALDNHLIATLHGESSGIQEAIILELVFYILNA